MAPPGRVNGLTGQPRLQGSGRQSRKPLGSLRIPLDPYRTDLHLLCPGLTVAVLGRIEVAQASLRQCPLEPRG